MRERDNEREGVSDLPEREDDEKSRDVRGGTLAAGTLGRGVMAEWTRSDGLSGLAAQPAGLTKPGSGTLSIGG